MKKILPILFYCLFCVTVTNLFAQQLQYNFRHLTPNEGLSNETVNAISEDHHGFVWLGTSFGLNRFDGVNLRQYFYKDTDTSTLSSSLITALFEDSKKRLWVGTDKGLNAYTFQTQDFKRFRASFNIVKVKEDNAGNIWVATTRGLKIADTAHKLLKDVHVTDTALNKLLQYGIRDIFYAAAEDKFYLAGSYGVLIINSKIKEWKLINNQTSTGKLIESNDAVAITVDKENQLWVVTDYTFSSLYVIDPNRNFSRQFDYFKKPGGKQLMNSIVSILCDSKNRIWFNATNFGLTVYNPVKNTFTSFLHQPLQRGSIGDDQCTKAILADKTGLIWVGVGGYGVDYFHPDRLLFSAIEADPFLKPTLLNNWARSVAEDSAKNLWLATARGVTVFNKEKGVIKNFNGTQLHSGSVRSLLNDNTGSIWIGTASGLNKYNIKNGSMRFYGPEDSLPYFFVHTLFKTTGGKIFAGGSQGLFEYLPATDKFYNLKTNPLMSAMANNVVTTIIEDTYGHWWFGTFGKGVFIVDPVHSTVQNILKTERAGGISDNAVQSLLPDNHGNMWIGTRNGLNCYNIQSGKNIVYGIDKGLPNTWICGMQLDKEDRLWVGTGKGLCVLNKAGDIFYQFNLSDGLTTTQFNDQDAFVINDGHFIFPSRKGFITFNPDDFNWKNESPVVYITRFNVLGKAKDIFKDVESLPGVILKPNENFFNIELRGLNYLNPVQCWYAYKLEDFDKDWIYTRDPVIKYTNVPAGEYQFKYKCSNNRHFGNAAEKSFSIIIETVFYKTWWFLSAMFLLMIAGLVVIFRYRIKQKEKWLSLENKAQLLEKEKALVMYENLKQQLNPHFLFNSLTSLSSLIRINQKMAGNFLDKMSKVYRYILKNRDNETVPLAEEIKFVQLYIDLQKTRFENGLIINMNIDEEYYHRKIAPVTLQNLVENAIKHNTADTESPLIIDLYVEDDYLVVKNNLQKKGFVETSNKQGLGNMQSLYRFLSERKMGVEEVGGYFVVRVPLI